MHYTQNDKIAQVGQDSLVIGIDGIDVGSEKQYARVFGPSQLEYTHKAFSFINSADGFDQFQKWAQDIQLKKGLKKIITVMPELLKIFVQTLSVGLDIDGVEFCRNLLERQRVFIICLLRENPNKVERFHLTLCYADPSEKMSVEAV